MITRTLLTAYRFHFANAGYRVGYHAADALELARAELLARAEGCSYSWEHDEDNFCDLRRFGTDSGVGMPGTAEVCTMLDPDGHAVANLGAIWDATDDYRRVIEAELAVEYYSEEARRARKTID